MISFHFPVHSSLNTIPLCCVTLHPPLHSSPLSLLPSSPLPSPHSLLQLKLAQTVKDAPVKGYHSAEGYIKQLLAKEGKLTAGAEDSLDWLKERSGKVSPCTVCVYAYCQRDTY